MNEMYFKIVTAVLEIFAMFAVGGLARHFKYINEKDLNDWSKLIIDFLFPLLVFSSIVSKFNPDRLEDLWLMPLIGFGLMAFGAALGYGLRYGLKNRSRDRMKTFHHFCAINNYGFLPIIMVTNLWDDSRLPLLFILNIGSTIGFWTIGVGLLGSGDIKRTLRNILTPSLIAVVLALFISIARLKFAIPGVLLKISGTLGNCAVPMMILIIGASLYGTPGIFKNIQDISYVIFVRLLLIPLLSILILAILPLPADAYQVAYIVAIMPTSVSSTIITRRFGGSPEFAGQAAVLTTIASLITIPIFVYFMRTS